MIRKIIALFLFFSCNEIDKILPESTGVFSEIVIVCDDVVWNDKLQNVLIETLALPIKGLPQPESSFNIIQINPNEFKSILKTHRNIIIFNEERAEGTYRDRWAKNQFIASLKHSNNRPELLEKILRLKSIFELREIKNIKDNIVNNQNKVFSKQMLKRFKIEREIPAEYKIAKDTLNLMWAAHNPANKEEIKNIIFFSYSLKSKNDTLRETIINKTDSILSLCLKGRTMESFVTIERRHPINKQNDFYRGLWKLEKGFMGGPFIMKKTSLDNSVIVSVGIVFAPNKSKRKFIKEFEAVL